MGSVTGTVRGNSGNVKVQVWEPIYLYRLQKSADKDKEICHSYYYYEYGHN
jgi:hypothetical protein